MFKNENKMKILILLTQMKYEVSAFFIRNTTVRIIRILAFLKMDSKTLIFRFCFIFFQ